MERPRPINPWWTLDEVADNASNPVRRRNSDAAARSVETGECSERTSEESERSGQSVESDGGEGSEREN
jgi:hypothetical protein